jgi:hypothetical protein
MRLPSSTLVLLMLLSATLAASAPPEPVPQAPIPPAGTSAPARAADSGRQSSTPARTFTPSEKIKADSAVAFPVDI